jgi:hypothetical protein
MLIIKTIGPQLLADPLNNDAFRIEKYTPVAVSSSSTPNRADLIA